MVLRGFGPVGARTILAVVFFMATFFLALRAFAAGFVLVVMRTRTRSLLVDVTSGSGALGTMARC